MLICIKPVGPKDGVALVPFRHIMVLVVQAGNRKVWEAGVHASGEQQTSRYQLYSRMSCSFSSSSSVSFLIEDSRESQSRL